jgi:predicted DNA binding protein
MIVTAAALHVSLLVVSAALTGGLAAYSWRRRDEPGVLPFALLMASVAVWAATYAAGVLTLDPRWRLVWQAITWLPIATIPVWFLLFALEYTGAEELATPRAAAVLLVVPAVTVVLVWTNPVHELIWTDTRVVVVDGVALVVGSFGPWFWIYLAYGYGLILLTAGLVTRLAFRSEYLFADQSALLLVGTAAPLAGNAASVFVATPPLPGIDLAPYGFIVTGVAFGYALFRRRLFDLVPATQHLGREAAIRDLDDGVLIVDADQQVVYCNLAAADLLDCEPAAAVLGAPIRSLVDASALDFDTEDALAELERDDRVYEVQTSPIRNRRDSPVGHTVVVQDITTRKRRERQLRRQRDELARLDKLNAVIRGVNQALVSATSYAEIERAVCDRLAEPELYRLICVADIPTWSGDADRWTVASADGGPTDDQALPGGAVDLKTDGNDSPPAVKTADNHPEGWTVVPLAYGRTVYGALGIRPGGDTRDGTGVTDREREVLAELGELIGQAINSVEHRQLLAAESVVELELYDADVDGPLVAAARATDANLKLSGLVPDAGDGHLAYVGVDDGDPTAAATALGAVEGADTRVVRGNEEDADGGLVEWTVPSTTLLGTLVDQGANVLDAVADETAARFTVEVASEADVRALVERIQREFPDTRVEAVHECDRPVERADGVSEEAIEKLTDRQQEAIEAAYRAGYYEWPRESTAEDIAETFGISSPTLHAHLRKAEGSLLAGLFDDERWS